jgi:hypothetical protein
MSATAACHLCSPQSHAAFLSTCSNTKINGIADVFPPSATEEMGYLVFALRGWAIALAMRKHPG